MTRTTIVLAVALVSWSATSRAQPSGAQAEVLFRQGRDLMKAGKYAQACAAFKESQKLEPAVTTLLNLAGCREKAGQLATAWGLFLDAERKTRAATDSASQQLHTIALAHARALEPRVSKLTINVPQGSQVDGLEIDRGKDRIDPAMWNRALPVDGGTYIITARAPGANAWSTQVTVAAEHDVKTVDIPDLRNLPQDVERHPASPAPTPAPKPIGAITKGSPPETPPPAHHSKVVPIAVGAGAVVLLGAALGLNFAGDSDYNSAKNEMFNQQRRTDLYNSANNKRYAAQGLAIAGVAAAGVAVWLYIRVRHADERAETETAHRLVVTPTGVAFVGSF